jgi:hypothetical protein
LQRDQARRKSVQKAGDERLHGVREPWRYSRISPAGNVSAERKNRNVQGEPGRDARGPGSPGAFRSHSIANLQNVQSMDADTAGESMGDAGLVAISTANSTPRYLALSLNHQAAIFLSCSDRPSRFATVNLFVPVFSAPSGSKPRALSTCRSLLRFERRADSVPRRRRWR